MYKKLLVALGLMLSSSCLAQDKPVATPGLEVEELAVLLTRESPAAERQALMQRLVASAQAGDGDAAFTLGALYRHGMEHPARLVERDPETARYWLEKCVDSARCPLMALASLAELELAAGQAKPAMQWAQAWVILERELDRRVQELAAPPARRASAYQHTAYHAYLIGRCYKAMPQVRDPGTLGLGWFDELRAARGPQLDRMLFAALDGLDSQGTQSGRGPVLEISAENQRSKTMEGNMPAPQSPALGLYLYRGAPQGGRAEALWVIEALPTPRSARGLDLHARGIRMKPYAADPPNQRAYARLPISFDDGQHSLVPAR